MGKTKQTAAAPPIDPAEAEREAAEKEAANRAEAERQAAENEAAERAEAERQAAEKEAADRAEAERQAAEQKASEHPFLAEFAADLPHEAAQGEYSFNQRDRWFGQPTDLADGWHMAGAEWMVRIEAGVPIEALRADHPTAQTLDFLFS